MPTADFRLMGVPSHQPLDPVVDNRSLTVSYTVSGTATPGVDYAALSGTITLGPASARPYWARTCSTMTTPNAMKRSSSRWSLRSSICRVCDRERIGVTTGVRWIDCWHPAFAVNSGQTTTTFTISTSAVTATTTVTITAGAGSGAKTASLTITP
jgi:hypothetical protein